MFLVEFNFNTKMRTSVTFNTPPSVLLLERYMQHSFHFSHSGSFNIVNTKSSVRWDKMGKWNGARTVPKKVSLQVPRDHVFIRWWILFPHFFFEAFWQARDHRSQVCVGPRSIFWRNQLDHLFNLFCRIPEHTRATDSELF